MSLEAFYKTKLIYPDQNTLLYNKHEKKRGPPLAALCLCKLPPHGFEERTYMRVIYLVTWAVNLTVLPLTKRNQYLWLTGTCGSRTGSRLPQSQAAKCPLTWQLPRLTYATDG